MTADPRVRLDVRAGGVSLLPRGPAESTGTGLVFYPGARVEPAAYAWKLANLAAAGVSVFVPAMPFGYAFLGAERADGIRDAHPEIRHWLVAVTRSAARWHVATPATGRASTSVSSCSPRGATATSRARASPCSRSGSHDEIATPAKVGARRDLLPADATAVVLDGANHASWGDYGTQHGDGVATASDEAVRDELTRRVLETAR